MKPAKKLTKHERESIRVTPAREELFFFLCELEPRLLTLLDMCRTVKREHDRCWKHFTWHTFWFMFIDPLMQEWVGWHTDKETTPAELRTSEAYDAVYMVLLAACPDCRCRMCNDEGLNREHEDWQCGHGNDEEDEFGEPAGPKCPHRSVFNQLPDSISYGEAARWNLDNWGQGRVYFIESGDFIKIGWSRKVEKRLAGLNGASPLPLKLLGDVPGSRVYERALHEKFRHLRHHGEWFSRDESLLAAVAQICAESVDKVEVTA